MSRGYPRAYRAQTVARAVAAARPWVGPALSIPGLGALTRLPIRLPPPHPVLFFGVLGAILAVYAYRRYQDWLLSDDNPAVLAPGLGVIEGQAGPNPHLQYIKTTYAPNWDIFTSPSDAIAFNSADAVGLLENSGPQFLGRVDQGGLPAPAWHIEDPYVPETVPPGWYLGVVDEVRQLGPTWYGYRWYSKCSVYYNPTDVDQPQEVNTPGRTMPTPAAVADLPRSRYIGRYHPLPAINHPVLPDRGIGQVPAVPGIINPMMPVPARRELKTAATAATMRVISATAGQLGETFDMTRCLMYATGNTYMTRGGVEKAIPKWRWNDALSSLVSGTSGPDFRRRRSVVYRNGSFIRPDGSILSADQVGYRLAECLALNWFEDLTIAMQSAVIVKIQNRLGLTVGPLGVESIVGLLDGSIPYEGLIDLNLQ